MHVVWRLVEKVKKKGVQMETNENKNMRKERGEEGMKDSKRKKMAQTIKLTEKRKE